MIESCQARTLMGARGGGRSLPKAAVPSKGSDLSSFREIMHDQQGEPHRRMASWGHYCAWAFRKHASTYATC